MADRVLLLGKNGQLGHALTLALALPASPAKAFTAWGREDFDLSHHRVLAEDLPRAVHDLSPTHIINAAAYTAVDQAQSDAAAAFAINEGATLALGKAAQAAGAWLIHYSTDYVFDGSGRRPWQEDDPTHPLNTYGASKRAGEACLENLPGLKYLIFRTSWVYGLRGQGNNFAKTMLRLALERPSLQVVNDQYGAPTSAQWLCEMTLAVLAALPVLEAKADRDDAASALCGIYHAAAAGETTWHGYACYLLARAEALGLSNLRATPPRILPVLSDHYPTAAPRPRNSRLDCSKLMRTFGAWGVLRPTWQQGVDDFLQAYLSTHLSTR